jgi:hypothetical protein
MTHAYHSGYTRLTPSNHRSVSPTDIMALAVGATLLFVLLTFGFAWQPWAESAVTQDRGVSQNHQLNVPPDTERQVAPALPVITGPCGCGAQDLGAAGPID